MGGKGGRGKCREKSRRNISLFVSALEIRARFFPAFKAATVGKGMKKERGGEKKDPINNTEWFRQFLLAHSYITFGTVVLT